MCIYVYIMYMNMRVCVCTVLTDTYVRCVHQVLHALPYMLLTVTE